MRIALFQPDIPQNTGTILRFCACMGLGADIIEPCGFVWHEKKMRRAGMDYLDAVDLRRHMNWQDFYDQTRKDNARILLLSTRAPVHYTEFSYQSNDILLMGQESAGAPDYVHDVVDARVIIPMTSGMRSINIALSASMVAGEAMRQTGQFPPLLEENLH